jgi:hypothetical protein
MSGKNKIYRLFTGCIVIIIFFLVLMERKSIKNNSAVEQPGISDKDIYEYELSTDKELQQQVTDFSRPESVLKLFHEHENRLDKFAEQCYMNRVIHNHFFVKYMNGERFYSCSSGTNLMSDADKDTAIQNEEHSYITSFMDYAIDNGIVFRDWMLDITMYRKVNDDAYKGREKASDELELRITIYEGEQFILSFLYSSDKDKDYTEKEYAYMGVCGGGPVEGRTTRINSNWYYTYSVMARRDGWAPELKDLAFADEFYTDRKTTTVTNNFLRENLRGFLRLYWKYGTDFTRISWRDWEEFRWNEPYNLECDIP